MKQETLEEAKYRVYKDYWNEYHTQHTKSNFLTAFKLGAKWQQERSYSEEEVKKILHDWSIYKVNCIVDEFIDILTWDEWFEKFKKK